MSEDISNNNSSLSPHGIEIEPDSESIHVSAQNEDINHKPLPPHNIETKLVLESTSLSIEGSEPHEIQTKLNSDCTKVLAKDDDINSRPLPPNVNSEIKLDSESKFLAENEDISNTSTAHEINTEIKLHSNISDVAAEKNEPNNLETKLASECMKFSAEYDDTNSRPSPHNIDTDLESSHFTAKKNELQDIETTVNLEYTKFLAEDENTKNEPSLHDINIEIKVDSESSDCTAEKNEPNGIERILDLEFTKMLTEDEAINNIPSPHEINTETKLDSENSGFTAEKNEPHDEIETKLNSESTKFLAEVADIHNAPLQHDIATETKLESESSGFTAEKNEPHDEIETKLDLESTKFLAEDEDSSSRPSPQDINTETKLDSESSGFTVEKNEPHDEIETKLDLENTKFLAEDGDIHSAPLQHDIDTETKLYSESSGSAAVKTEPHEIETKLDSESTCTAVKIESLNIETKMDLGSNNVSTEDNNISLSTHETAIKPVPESSLSDEDKRTKSEPLTSHEVKRKLDSENISISEQNINKRPMLSIVKDSTDTLDPKSAGEHRMIKLVALPFTYSIDDIKELIEEYCTKDMKNGIESVCGHVKSKKTTAVVIFKTAELAQQAKSLLEETFKVHIGTYEIDPKYLDKVIEDNVPVLDPKTGKPKTCHICKEIGHYVKNCPKRHAKTPLAASSADSIPVSDPKTGKPKTCHICKEIGHYVKNCPQRHAKTPLAASSADSNTTQLPTVVLDSKTRRNMTCYHCRCRGHKSDECFKNPSNRALTSIDSVQSEPSNTVQPMKRLRVPPKICLLCKDPGHFIKDCPQRDPNQLPTKPCRLCKKLGHFPFQCPSVSSADTASNTSTVESEPSTTLLDSSVETETSHISQNLGHDNTECPQRDPTQTVKRPASDDIEAPVLTKQSRYEQLVQDVMRLINVPAKWDESRVLAYIRHNTNTDIYREVICVYSPYNTDPVLFKKYERKWFVKFKSDIICSYSIFLLNKNKEITCGYERLGKPILWRADGTPDHEAMVIREMELQQLFWQKRQKIFMKSHSLTQSSTFEDDMVPIEDDSETYGLSPDFLKSIGVEPPLTSAVYVTKLPHQYYDKDKVRELFSHAGTVLSVVPFQKPYRLAFKVDFDHPVEAVQAISMFHDQKLYNTNINVKMFKNTGPIHACSYLPGGLNDFGPGLGINGVPLKDVSEVMELRDAVKNFMKDIESIKIEQEEHQRKHDQINTRKSRLSSKAKISHNDTHTHDGNIAFAVNNDIPDALATLASSLTNPVANNPLLALGALLNPQTSQMLQLLTQQSTGDNFLAGINTLLSQVNSEPQGNQQPQMAPIWNVGQPTNLQNPSIYDYNMPTTNMQDVSMQALPNWQNVQHMQGVQNMHGVQYVQGVQHMQSVQNMQGAQNLQGVHNIQGLQNMQGVQSMQGIQNIQGLQHMQSAQNMQNANNMQGVQNIQNLQNMQGVLNMQGVQNIQGAQNIHANVQSASPRVPSVPDPPSISSVPIKTSDTKVGKVKLNIKPKVLVENIKKTSWESTKIKYNIGKTKRSADSLLKEDRPKRNKEERPRASTSTKSKMRDDEENTDDDDDDDDKCTVLFNYLPPSVTSASLYKKMSEIGLVRSSELTGSGRALVSFYSRKHAAYCIKIFNGTKVDDQVIDVRYL